MPGTANHTIIDSTNSLSKFHCCTSSPYFHGAKFPKTNKYTVFSSDKNKNANKTLKYLVKLKHCRIKVKIHSFTEKFLFC